MRKTIFRLALITIAVLLVAVALAAAQTGTVVRVEPAFQQVAPGATFTLTIQIDDVVNLYGFDILVSFPPDKLEAINAANGDFLQEGIGGDPIINNEEGTIWTVNSQVAPAEPKSGSGSLVVITFQAEADRTDADIVLSAVTLSERDGVAIACSLQHGRVHIGAYPLYLPLVLR